MESVSIANMSSLSDISEEIRVVMEERGFLHKWIKINGTPDTHARKKNKQPCFLKKFFIIRGKICMRASGEAKMYDVLTNWRMRNEILFANKEYTDKRA